MSIRNKLKSKVSNIQNQLIDYSKEILDKDLLDLSENDLSVLSTNENTRDLFYDKIIIFFKDKGFEFKKFALNPKYYGLILRNGNEKYNNKLMFWLINGKFMIRFDNDGTFNSYRVKHFIRIILNSLTNFNDNTIKTVSESIRDKLKSKVNEINQQKIEFIENNKITPDNFQIIIDKYGKTNYEIDDLVFNKLSDNKKEEIMKLRNKLLYHQQRIFYYLNLLKEIVSKKGLLKDNIEIDLIEDWESMGFVHYGYIYNNDIDIIGTYNVDSDSFNLDNEGLNNIIYSSLYESIKHKLKSKSNKIEKQKEEYIKEILEKSLKEITYSDLRLLSENEETRILFYNKVIEFLKENGISSRLNKLKYIGVLVEPNDKYTKTLMFWLKDGEIKLLDDIEDNNWLRFYEMKEFIDVILHTYKVGYKAKGMGLPLFLFTNLAEGIRDKLKSKSSEIEKQKEEYIKEIMEKPLKEITHSDIRVLEIKDLEKLGSMICDNIKPLNCRCSASKTLNIRGDLNFYLNGNIEISENFGFNFLISNDRFDITKWRRSDGNYSKSLSNLGELFDFISHFTKEKLTEQNSELEGKEFNIPQFVKDEINKKRVEYGMSTKRSNYLLGQERISYYELKRLKNYFDNNDSDSVEYQVIGGNIIKSWVESILNQHRGQIHKKKEILYDIGLDNQFKKTHTKNKGVMVKPTLGVDKVASDSRKLFNNLKGN
jgi:predicted DNA-binding protein